MAPSSSTVTDWATWAFSPANSAIIVTILVALLLPVLLHYFLHRQASGKELSSFLLVGPSGGGKTSLLTLFANGTTSETHTSQTTQSALCQLPSTTRSSEDRYRSEHDTSARTQLKFLLVDTPGHGKLRQHALSSLTSPSALKGLIFVVDSAALSSQTGLTEAAEYLHDILLLLQKRHAQAKSEKDKKGMHVLVAANKQDVFTSLPAGLAKSALEAEINKIRATKSKALLDSGIGMDNDEGGADEANNWLGEYGSKTFAFGQMEEYGVDVSVIGGNIKGDGDEEGNVKDWWSWISDNV